MRLYLLNEVEPLIFHLSGPNFFVRVSCHHSSAPVYFIHHYSTLWVPLSQAPLAITLPLALITTL